MATPHKWKDVIIAIANGVPVQFRLTEPMRTEWIEFNATRHESPIAGLAWVEWQIKPESGGRVE